MTDKLSWRHNAYVRADQRYPPIIFGADGGLLAYSVILGLVGQPPK